MIAAGVDIGSTACKALIFQDQRIAGYAIGPATANPARTAEEILQQAREEAGLADAPLDRVVGTGYGRALVPFADENVSELTCHGRGASFVLPGVGTVLDIGGQDTKAIRVDEYGFLLDFAMNDKCAAGTGRFMEAMARTLGLPIEELDDLPESDAGPCTITSMCSVFAESEVINLINEGVEADRIVRGLQDAMAGRVAALARRVGVEGQVLVTGGVAKSRGVIEALTARLGISPARFPEHLDPQIVGALGAAITAAEEG